MEPYRQIYRITDTLYLIQKPPRLKEFATGVMNAYDISADLLELTFHEYRLEHNGLSQNFCQTYPPSRLFGTPVTLQNLGDDLFLILMFVQRVELSGAPPTFDLTDATPKTLARLRLGSGSLLKLRLDIRGHQAIMESYYPKDIEAEVLFPSASRLSPRFAKNHHSECPPICLTPEAL